MASVKGSGLGIAIDVTDHSPEVQKALKNAIERGLEAIGTNAQEHASHIITEAGAVVTGRLRGSITHKVEEKAVVIGTNVEYARGIETGTHRRKGAVHFLQRAANDYKDEYRKLMKDSLENA